MALPYLQTVIPCGIFDRAVAMSFNPKMHPFYAMFHDHIITHINPEPYLKYVYKYDERLKFRCVEKGQPPISPCVMVGALLLAAAEHMPLEILAEHLKTDVAYQYALDITGINARIPSYTALRNFQTACRTVQDTKNIDLIGDTFRDLSAYFCQYLNIDISDLRTDSFLLEIHAKDLSRFELLYVCAANYVKYLNRVKVKIPDELSHFLDKTDYNKVTYHSTDSEETKTATLLREASTLMDNYADGHEHSKEFINLKRVLREQTEVDEKGTRHLREAGDPVLRGIYPDSDQTVAGSEGDPAVKKSPILQTPVDPEATYNGKRGEDHRGYSGTVLEASGPYGPILVDYTLQPNVVGDNKMCLEMVQRLPHAENGGRVVGDASFWGDELRAAVTSTNRTLVLTNVSGKLTPDFMADLKFREDDITVSECPGHQAPIRTRINKDGSCSCWFDKAACAKCPYYQECHPELLKTRDEARRVFSQKQQVRAVLQRELDSDEFYKVAAFRNGIEALFSLLRRAYGIDHLHVYGLLRIRFRFGLILTAVNIKKFYFAMMEKASRK